MANNISEMIKILEKEANIYNQMLDISMREREAMTAYSMEDLLACHKTRKSVHVQYKQLEENRFVLTSAIAKKMKRPVASINVSTMMDGAEPDEMDALKKCRANLKTAVELFLRVNGENRLIAKNSISFINKSVRILSGFKPSGTVYQSNGMIQVNDSSGCRMKREV